jgi:hypothetical protein
VAHRAHFKGILHVDGYAGFERLTGNGDIVLAARWAHTRRKFYEIAEATGSPVSVNFMPSKRACAGNPPLIGLPSGAPSPGGSRKRCITWLEAQLPRLAVRSTLLGQSVTRSRAGRA